MRPIRAVRFLIIALFIPLVWIGCSPPPTPSASPSGTAGTPSEGHHHSAPHGGTLVEMGEEFAHLELVLDAETGTLTVYVLDGEAEHALPLDKPSLTLTVDSKQLPLEPVADELTGETTSNTSTFRVTSEQLKGRKSFEGTLSSITVKGQTFEALDLGYPNGHEDHSHDDHKESHDHK